VARLRSDLGNANCSRLEGYWSQPDGAHGRKEWRQPTAADWWPPEPRVGRVAHGVPRRMDRLRGLGNAVVPKIPEIIGCAILEWERQQ
jgi:hypothetical protein